MSSLLLPLSVRGGKDSAEIAHIMKEQVDKLQQQVDELTRKLDELIASQVPQFKGTLDDVQVERVMETDTSGTPSTNTLLRTVNVTVSVPYSLVLSGNPETLTGTLTGTGTITVLDYPERLKIDTWKGQRLVVPVYDADKIIYP